MTCKPETCNHTKCVEWKINDGERKANPLLVRNKGVSFSILELCTECGETFVPGDKRRNAATLRILQEKLERAK